MLNTTKENQMLKSGKGWKRSWVKLVICASVLMKRRSTVHPIFVRMYATCEKQRLLQIVATVFLHMTPNFNFYKQFEVIVQESQKWESRQSSSTNSTENSYFFVEASLKISVLKPLVQSITVILIWVSDQCRCDIKEVSPANVRSSNSLDQSHSMTL